jgi:hypothetical protein
MFDKIYRRNVYEIFDIPYRPIKMGEGGSFALFDRIYTTKTVLHRIYARPVFAFFDRIFTTKMVLRRLYTHLIFVIEIQTENYGCFHLYND